MQLPARGTAANGEQKGFVVPCAGMVFGIQNEEWQEQAPKRKNRDFTAKRRSHLPPVHIIYHTSCSAEP